jgi:hypothetical protein
MAPIIANLAMKADLLIVRIVTKKSGVGIVTTMMRVTIIARIAGLAIMPFVLNVRNIPIILSNKMEDIIAPLATRTYSHNARIATDCFGAKN